MCAQPKGLGSAYISASTYYKIRAFRCGFTVNPPRHETLVDL